MDEAGKDNISHHANKRRRIDETLHLASEELSDALQPMVALLLHWERLALAETCKSIRRLVEKYCQATLTQHILGRADDSFLDRLQVSYPSADPPPYRYLLPAGKKSYLYKLNVMPESHRFSCSMTVSANRLVIAAILFERSTFITHSTDQSDPSDWPHIITVSCWDISSKQALGNFTVPVTTSEYAVMKVVCVQEFIVVSSNKRIKVLSNTDGVVLHDYLHDAEIVSAGVRHGDHSILFADSVKKVYSFDVRSGLAQFLMQVGEGRVGFWVQVCLLSLCNSRWLIARDGRGDVGVYDVENGCRRVESRGGFYRSLVLSPDCPNTLYHINCENSIEVLKVDHQTGNFSVDLSCSVIKPEKHKRALLSGSFQSRVFLEVDDFDDLLILNTKDGQVQEGSLKLPGIRAPAHLGPHFETCSIGKELFFALEPNHERGLIVAAYLAPGHL